MDPLTAVSGHSRCAGLNNHINEGSVTWRVLASHVNRSEVFLRPDKDITSDVLPRDHRLSADCLAHIRVLFGTIYKFN